MFERYTEKARRTIFFARYEASQYGSPYIEAEFLLLGLLRENKALAARFFPSHASYEAIRLEIDRHQPVAEKTSTSVDLPLSTESKRILAYAAEEAERLGHHFIGSEHLFLGILREQGCFAAQLLQQQGINLEAVRKDVAEGQPPDISSHPPRSTGSTLGFFQLALKVASLEASIDFYKKLGFTPVRTLGLRSAVLTNGSCNLRLDENLEAGHQLAFLSPDIAKTVSRLRSAGLEFEQPPHTAADGNTSASLRDPDGNVIALVSPHHASPAAE